jgi:hypothetical protein
MQEQIHIPLRAARRGDPSCENNWLDGMQRRHLCGWTRRNRPRFRNGSNISDGVRRSAEGRGYRPIIRDREETRGSSRVGAGDPGTPGHSTRNCTRFLPRLKQDWQGLRNKGKIGEKEAQDTAARPPREPGAIAERTVAAVPVVQPSDRIPTYRLPGSVLLVAPVLWTPSMRPGSARPDRPARVSVHTPRRPPFPRAGDPAVDVRAGGRHHRCRGRRCSRGPPHAAGPDHPAR